MGAFLSKRAKTESTDRNTSVEKKLHDAINDNHQSVVKTIIAKHPDLLRTEIWRGGWSPLHLACLYNQEEIALFLIKEEKKRVGEKEEGQPWIGNTPSYNMRDKWGAIPLFMTSSLKIVKELISFEDLEVTSWNGMPLLWHCAHFGCVTERVASNQKLSEQYAQRWFGRLPLEEGINENDLSTCIELVKGLYQCGSNIKAMNLRALLANSKFQEEIFKVTWKTILSWEKQKRIGLTHNETLRLMAILMRIKEDMVWYNKNFTGKERLLWLFACDGNFQMIKYMQSLPGIEDTVMEDGTTAFAMALAKGQCNVIKELLQSKRTRDIKLARYALMEPMINDKMRQVLWDIVGKVGEGTPAKLSKDMIEMIEAYPYLNEEAETEWKVGNCNMEMSQHMKQLTQRFVMQVETADQFKVHDMNFEEQDDTSVPLVKCSQHSTTKEKLDHDMVEDLLEVVRQIERRFRNDETIKHLKPKFNLVGSVREGTRFGYGNELDFGLRFEALQPTGGENDSKENIAFKIGDDPYSLKRADTRQTQMDIYFNSHGEFQSHKFKCCLLKATDKAITGLFDEGDNPGNLHRIITNKDWLEGRTPCKGRCKIYLEQHGYKHCKKCPVVVSQTKIGITLQFVWKWPGDKTSQAKDIYASIDFIPEYGIIPIEAIKLAKTVNSPMIHPEEQPPPKGFIRYLTNYDMHYKINLSQDGFIYNVGLKDMSLFEGRNHHIRPAQPSDDEGRIFSSERMRRIYGYIKFLKKNVEGLELSSFRVKRELLKNHYEAILDSCKNNDNRAVVAILSQPEFRSRVEGSRIDLENSIYNGKISFKILQDS